MRTLNAFYFSGTGNTRYVTRRLCQKLSVKFRTSAYDITDKADYYALLKEADIILLAYPIYGSAPPIPMCKFVHRYGADIAGREVIIVLHCDFRIHIHMDSDPLVPHGIENNTVRAK